LVLAWAAAVTGARDWANDELCLTAPLAAALGRPDALFSLVTPPVVVTPAPRRVLAATRVAGASTGPVRVLATATLLMFVTLLLLIFVTLLMFVTRTLLFTRLNEATWKPERWKNGSPPWPKKKSW
jgi:hypothetical protein